MKKYKITLQDHAHTTILSIEDTIMAVKERLHEGNTKILIEKITENFIWVKTSIALPPEYVIVETKLDDVIDGKRNVQPLIRVNRLWHTPDMAMYVYYQPTHWRKL